MNLDSLKSWVKKNEKYLSLAFFTGGLILDNLTLTRIDLLFDNLVLLSYLSLAILSIILINYSNTHNLKGTFFKYLPFVTQFAFGGLFSGYIIFYTKSASLTSSWIFLLVIYAMFLGNERFRQKYKKIDFQINILFVAIFSFMIFFIPVVLKRIGDLVFILSGLVSLALIYLFYQFLFKFVFANEVKQPRKNTITKHIIGIYLVFNLMYFTNIIPPVPLSSKEIGIYENVQRISSGNYLLKEYDQPWYQFGNFFIKVPQGTTYVFSSVFAPTDLDTDIVNVWSHYNEEEKEWVVQSEITYPIRGGRGEGYRGYSFLENLEKGKWRVDITNERGQVLGRIKFWVE